jgi:hypothetical protein
VGDRGIHPINLAKTPDVNGRVYSNRYKPLFDKNKTVYGNKSKNAVNWANGPTHMIRRQEVPGYTGHVKGLISENLFSEGYALSTAKAYTKRHSIGHVLSPKAKY